MAGFAARSFLVLGVRLFGVSWSEIKLKVGEERHWQRGE